MHVAGAGFEPATSRLWAWRAATALPRDKKNQKLNLRYKKYKAKKIKYL